jgi:hypothetical protein
VDLADEVRAALADGEPLGDPEARDLILRLLEALEVAEDELADADVPARQAEAAELVDEARRARERILRDLARRRHEARREVAQLQAGRDRLLETFAAIRGTIDASTRELNLALAEARLRAGEAGREIDRQDLPTAAALDAELELARLARLPLVAPERPDDQQDDAVLEQLEAEEVPLLDDAEAPPPESGPHDEGEVEVEQDPPPEAAAPEPGPVSEATPAAAEPVAPGRVREPVEAIVQGTPAVEPVPEEEAEPTPLERVEQRAAQRLKRVLADEQNEVLDRIRQRDRRRTLTVDLVLGGDLDRIARYRDALLVVLVDADLELDADPDHPSHAQADAVASDAAEAIVRGTRSRVEALLDEAVDGRTVDEDRVVDGVRACFREWKTQWLVRLAADSVALASAGHAEPA